MKDIYIHIGYPKCMSTALQRSLFESHLKISFGGVGIKDNISYANKEIEELFEIILKYASQPYYRKHFSKIKKSVSDFIKNSGKSILFSNEHLAMNFSLQGIPNFVKYKRLKEIFEGYNIKVIVLKRKPIEIVRGVYKEYIVMGYDQSYETYLKWLITHHDRNFLSDIAFHQKDKELKKFFGKGNVKWINYNILNPANKIPKQICNYIGVPFHKEEKLEKINQSLNEREINILLKINQTKKRGMGLRMTEPFERHRNRIAYRQANLNISENQIFSNILAKRKALKQIAFENNTEKVFNKSPVLEKEILNIVSDYNEI